MSNPKNQSTEDGPAETLAVAAGSASLIGYRFVSLMGGWGDMEWEVESEVITALDGTNRPFVWANVIGRVPSRRGANRIKRGAPKCRRLFFLPLPRRSNDQVQGRSGEKRESPSVGQTPAKPERPERSL
jgi:hypothetical protein